MPKRTDNAALAQELRRLIEDGKLSAARDRITHELDLRNPPPPFAEIVGLYNRVCSPRLPRINGLSGPRERALRGQWRKHPDLGWWEAYFRRIAQAPFLTGQVTNWRASFDWIIKDANIIKVLDGNYDPRDRTVGLTESENDVYRMSVGGR